MSSVLKTINHQRDGLDLRFHSNQGENAIMHRKNKKVLALFLCRPERFVFVQASVTHKGQRDTAHVFAF